MLLDEERFSGKENEQKDASGRTTRMTMIVLSMKSVQMVVE